MYAKHPSATLPPIFLMLKVSKERLSYMYPTPTH